MKRLRPLFPLLMLLVLIACRDDDIERPNRPDVRQRLSLKQARAAYDSSLQRTTRAEMEPGVLYAGEIELFWDEAQFSENDCVSSFDVRIRAERYYETVEEEDIAEICLFPKVVVVNDKQDEESISAYVTFYFPDHAEQLDDEHVGDDYLNSLPKLNYSGRIVYTDLQGYPVAASRYLDGRQTDRVFLYDARDSLSLVEFIDHYNRMVEDICIRLFYDASETRSDTMIVGTGFDNDPAVCIGITTIKAPKINLPSIDDYYKALHSEADPTQGSSGGSSGNGASSRGAYANNPKIKTDNPEIQKMLDSIYMDCMGKTLIDNLKDSVIIQTIGVPDNKNSCDPYNEEGISKIMFGDIHNKQRTYVLLEELIHSYQYQDETLEQANPHKLNYEIEAKVGWLLYEQRNRDSFNIFNYSKGLGGKKCAIYFLNLAYCYPNTEFVQFNEYYDNIVYIFQNSYTSYASLQADSAYKNYSNIQELMINCTQP